MPTRIKTRAASTEQERQRVCQAANNCIEQHRRTTHTAELAALIAQRDALTA